MGEEERLRARAEAAEATVERVRALADDWDSFAGPGSVSEQVFGRQVVTVEHIVSALREALAAPTRD